jgi:outer membrane protein assembly factor BamB
LRFRTSVGVAIVVLSAMGVFLGSCGSTGSNGNPGNATAPQITSQPADRTVTVGQTATFSVMATGTQPLTYQWQRGTQNVGTNSNTYTTPATQTSDSGAKFRVIVTNSAGSATSSQATLTVNSGSGAPVITQQPASLTVTDGQPANFSVAATGAAPLSYQWTKNGANVGTNSSTYNIAATVLADNNAMIQVRVSNASGNMLSNTATLTVKPPPPPGNASVLTFHNDSGRTGQNLGETVLTPTNVNSTTFGKLATLAVDGLVDAEPLYVSNLTVGGAPHNVVFVVTEHDSVYAFDADTFTQLWKVTALGSGESTSDDRGCSQVTPEIGITSTPAIDTKAGAHGTMYLVAMSKNGSNYFQRLHALDITTGAEESGSPVLIQGSFTRPVVGGLTTFDAKQYKARPGLLLMNGVIYIAWASHCDINPYQGWVMGYSQSTLQQSSIINVTPNGSEGAIWMAGYGLAGDSSGNIYFLDANGTFDDTLDINSNPNMADYGNGFLKLSTAGNTLAMADYFNMHDTDGESNADEDLGSGGAMVLPDVKDNIGNTWHLAVGSGKDAAIYVVNRDQMGKFNVSNDNAIYQQLAGATGGGVRGGPAFFNNTVYFSGVGDTLKAFPISNAKLATSPSSHTASSFNYPGSIPSISANGNTNGIVWTVENAGGGLLHAYDATSLGKELYNSNQAANGRDNFSNNKFITPMIANGKVFVGTPNSVVVFGLLP